MFTRYEDKTPVIYFAQLAMDCYNNPKDDEYRKQFNKSWVKVDQFPRNSWGMARDIGKPSSADEDPKTGFYSNFYLNTTTNVGVMAIRGTDSVLDQMVDATFVLNKAIKQYDQALSYFQYLQRRFPNVKRFYVCGHSLGGIISKMIFPRTKVNTIAFNSPGVVQYLKENNKPYIKSASSNAMCVPILEPIAITYCANGCPIGNLRHDNDVGVYKWIPVLGEERIPDNADKIKNVVGNDALAALFPSDFVKHALYNEQGRVFLKYHSIADMYKCIKNNEYKNDRI